VVNQQDPTLEFRVNARGKFRHGESGLHRPLDTGRCRPL
jgi:hypothetical protein